MILCFLERKANHMKHLKYPHLFEPVLVGNTMFRNRILAAPMGVPRAIQPSTDNYGGISLYDKSLGKAAAVTVTGHYLALIAHEKSAFDKYARDLTRETLSVMKQGGSLALYELMFHSHKRADGTNEAPSDGTFLNGETAGAMSRQEITACIEEAAKEAAEARNFGFDGVMLHFGHDSLNSLFLSPVWNQRTDEFGGSLENRCRLGIEALRAIRLAVGKDYPLMMRISRHLGVKESYAEDDMMYFLKQCEGLVNIVNVSMGMDCYGGTIDRYEANGFAHSTVFEPRMHNLAFCERLKKETAHTVCIVGGVNDPAECEKIIKEGKTDFVMLGRQLVADPFWPLKAQEGRDDDIVPCLRCLNCYHISTEHYNTQCSVNPRFRRENRVPLKLSEAEVTRKVMVIGGGPAGMKAALTAKERGHEVILAEKSDQLGGMLKYADYGDHKKDLRRFREYLIHQVEKSGIRVLMNTEADQDLIRREDPDALFVCVGSKPAVPPITGIENTVQALSVYKNQENYTGRIAIIGGGAIGCELGIELADGGCEVTVIEMAALPVPKENWLYRHGFTRALAKRDNMKVLTECRVKQVSENSLTYITKDGTEVTLETDHVINAAGMVSLKKEANAFYGLVPDTYLIGDCARIGNVMSAVNEAYFLAANL